MKLRVFLLFALLALCLQAYAELIVVPGSGKKDSDQAKDYHFRYHNLSDDFHLSGLSKWAIRFNFREYAVSDSATFNLSAVRIYNPLAGTSTDLNLRLSLWEEISVTSYTGLVMNYPGSQIGEFVTQNGIANGQEIVIPNVQDSLKVAWLVIEMDIDNLAGRYLSASEGNGTHSYYHNGSTNDIAGNHWLSLNAAGFDCELRFGLIGSFNLNNPRLELSDFKLEGSLYPGTRVYPRCSVFNHASTALSDSLNVLLSGPIGSNYLQSVKIPLRDMAPQDYSSYVFEDGITLPETPMQLKLQLSFAQNSAYPVSSSYVNVFGDTLRFIAVEDFHSSSAALAAIPADTEQVHHLMYIPVQGDELSNLEATQRYNYYQFSTLPKTVVMGGKRFQMPVTIDSLQAAISTALQKKSFISSGFCEITAADTINIMNRLFSFSLENEHTDFDAWTSTFSPKFFAGICEGDTISGRVCWVIKHWLAFDDPVAFMDLGGRFTGTVTYNVNDLSREKDYRVYYWLQNSLNNGAEVYYFNWRPLIIPVGVPVSNDDLCIGRPVLSAYPNPLYGKVDLKTGEFTSPVKLAVYNLKGQCIYKKRVEEGSWSIPAEVFPASGIYFLRSEPVNGLKQSGQTIKITIIK